MNSCLYTHHHLSQTLAVTGECVCVLQGHTGYVRTLTVVPGGQLASGGDDGCLKIWVCVLGQVANVWWV